MERLLQFLVGAERDRHSSIEVLGEFLAAQTGVVHLHAVVQPAGTDEHHCFPLWRPREGLVVDAAAPFVIPARSNIIENPALLTMLQQRQANALTPEQCAQLGLGDEPPEAILLPLIDSSPDQCWLLLLADKTLADRFGLQALLMGANLVIAVQERDRMLAELGQAQSKCQAGIDQIADIQRALLPRNDLRVPGLQARVHFKAAAGVGGDYYDFVPLVDFDATVHPRRWGVMIADAAGHGPGAAVEVAMLDAILRTYVGSVEDGPGEVLRYANRYLFTRRIRPSFITACLVEYDPDSGYLRYASAGHPPGWLKPADGGPLLPLQDSPGIPLGVEREGYWRVSSVRAVPGDCIVLYTDGVCEAQSVAGEPFSLARMQGLVEQAPTEPEAIIAALQVELERHQGGVPIVDDQTLLALRIEA